MRKVVAALLLALSPSVACATTYVSGLVGHVFDGSGTITAGGTSQVVFPVNAYRYYLTCQNPIAATETLFVNFGASASSGSIGLAPGGSVTFADTFIPSDYVSVTAATTGHAFVCKQAVGQ